MTDVVAMVIAALCLVESGNRADAVNGEAVGILQITPIAVAEANRIVGWERWGLEDRLHPVRSVEMAWATLMFHYQRGVRDPVALGCRWKAPYAEAPWGYQEKVRLALDGRRVRDGSW